MTTPLVRSTTARRRPLAHTLLRVAAVALLAALVACTPPVDAPDPDPTPAIDAFVAALTVGDTLELTARTATTMPATYVWWSSDDGVATVAGSVAGDLASTATLTAVGAGSASISFGDPDAGAPAESVDSVDVTVVEPAPPELTLETLANWWATTPAAELSTFATLRIQMTFENQSGATVVFEGTGSGAGPADELQVWTVPNVEGPVVTFDAFPEGSYAVGATFSWDITMDVASLDPSDTGIAVRPQPAGTLGPDSVTLVDATVTLDD